ncbi:NAP1-related protein 2-like isoform X2 [Macadamia integrifolia]|uniref:NAP1-related protein 2-like isoform X2 n=1 Tax=Macadamia integrifolia TaxID=60698 RepID=UPI001C4EE206|nr:NAP1-related protein 2-like isoform X2 [Macadamia integrifolia]
MVADKAKKPKVAEKGEEEESDHIDGELVLSIEKLQEIQDELEKVNEEASDKVLEVEQKYNEIRRPVYEKRNEIIKSIPDFWLTAFLSHPALGDLLSEEDQKSFGPNPHFEDTKLTKTFTFFDEGTTKITGTTIKWKEGMDIANGGNHEKKGSKRPIAEESFFSWFSETQQKDISEGIHDEVAEIIKEDLWPNPLKYFNNEADEEDIEDIDGDDDDDDDDEEVTRNDNTAALDVQPNFLVVVRQFLIAMLVLDTWQYFMHRYMHHNKFLYRHIHSQHHRLIVPYAFGALYNHPLEGLILDTIGGALSFLLSGMSPRISIFFFSFATIKTVDDHCGLWLPGNLFRVFFRNNTAYHDVHHQLYGNKYNFSQPFFVLWDRILGTYMPYTLKKRDGGGFEVCPSTDYKVD